MDNKGDCPIWKKWRDEERNKTIRRLALGFVSTAGKGKPAIEDAVQILNKLYEEQDEKGVSFE